MHIYSRMATSLQCLALYPWSPSNKGPNMNNTFHYF
uniref:Uncharacterized protein n=1 Tax=Rhizophora mucronata TaxID=61149 RepID=A0A2P2QXU8_RHIMU